MVVWEKMDSAALVSVGDMQHSSRQTEPEPRTDERQRDGPSTLPAESWGARERWAGGRAEEAGSTAMLTGVGGLCWFWC